MRITNPFSLVCILFDYSAYSCAGVDTFLTWATVRMRSMRKNSINPIRSVRSSLKRRRERRREEEEGIKSEDTNIELELGETIHNLEEREWQRISDQNFLTQELLTVSRENAEIHVHREGLNTGIIYTI